MSSKTKADNFPLNETVRWTSFDLFNFLLEGDELLVTSEIDRFKCDPQIFDFVGGADGAGGLILLFYAPIAAEQ